MAIIAHFRLVSSLCFVFLHPAGSTSFWKEPSADEIADAKVTTFSFEDHVTALDYVIANASGGYLVFHKFFHAPGTKARMVSSWWKRSGPRCQLNISVCVSDSIGNGKLLSIFVRRENVEAEIVWTLDEASAVGSWTSLSVDVGSVAGPFLLVLESMKGNADDNVSVAVGQTSIFNCDPKKPSGTECSLREFLCPSTSVCVPLSSVCDFQDDCQNGEDEEEELCRREEFPGVCDFELDTCQWKSVYAPILSPMRPHTSMPPKWKRHVGTARSKASPGRNNTSGRGGYMVVEQKGGELLDVVYLESPPFPAPPQENWNVDSPYYQTCQVTFYHQKFTHYAIGADLSMYILEVEDKCCNHSTCTPGAPGAPDGSSRFWVLKTADAVDKVTWSRVSFPLPPPVRKRFVIRFEATIGMRASYFTLDDFSLSRECFGQGIMNLPLPATDDCVTSGNNNYYNESTNHTVPDSEDTPRSSVLYGVLAMIVGVLMILAVIMIIAIISLLSARRRQRNFKQRLNGNAEEHQSLHQQHQQQQQQPTADVDHQLNVIRSQRNAYLGKIVNYNPSYEFAGNRYTVNDLAVISRTNITLVKALGHGAFGEVYQGILIDITKQPTRCPVAIKTLPALSTKQAQEEFITEALIMSVFDHKNIVKVLGVCFDRHPQFLVLELLEGGDVKTFLYRSRPKPNVAVELTVQDLLHLSLDIAQGCHYLEEKRFVHRDIAARNCLITTKSWGRVAKIADFGMARDVKSDYYKKSGKAMLPVRWMPPEALLNGIFTTKTDVWSFGVVLWEIFSLGYRPYPGLSNQEVIQLVTTGGRLRPPDICPAAVSRIMTLCWTGPVNDRPNFDVITHLLQECLKDPCILRQSLSSTPCIDLCLPPADPRLSYLPILYDASVEDSDPEQSAASATLPLPPLPSSDQTPSSTTPRQSPSETKVQPRRSEQSNLLYVEPVVSREITPDHSLDGASQHYTESLVSRTMCGAS